MILWSATRPSGAPSRSTSARDLELLALEHRLLILLPFHRPGHVAPARRGAAHWALLALYTVLGVAAATS